MNGLPGRGGMAPAEEEQAVGAAVLPETPTRPPDPEETPFPELGHFSGTALGPVFPEPRFGFFRNWTSPFFRNPDPSFFRNSGSGTLDSQGGGWS